MPEGLDFGYFIEINMTIGLLVGWTVIGARSGFGYRATLGVGVSGAIMLVFWCVLLYSCVEMFNRALNNRFDQPFDALLFIPEIGVEYVITIASPMFVLTVLFGGAASGLVAEFACQRRRSRRGSV